MLSYDKVEHSPPVFRSNLQYKQKGMILNDE